jgi:hypothetical protein
MLMMFPCPLNSHVLGTPGTGRLSTLLGPNGWPAEVGDRPTQYYCA